MTHSIFARWRCTGLPVLVAWALVPVMAGAQQPERRTRAQQTTRAAQSPQADDAAQTRQGNNGIRTSDGMLSLKANFPSEIRTGAQFTYQVTVENATDNMSLHDIKLRHREKSGLTIESVSIQGEERQQRQKQQEQQQQEEQQQEEEQQEEQQQEEQQQTSAEQEQKEQDQEQKQKEQKQQEQKQQEQKQQEQKQKEQKQKEQQQQAEQVGDQKSLTIEELGPGESRTLIVTASTDTEGTVDACLIIESYKPAICLQTKSVKPDLQIVKTAPEEVRQCDIIELVYTVENGGTGTVGEFQIVDELAEGLKTIDGQDKLAFTVDELEAGDTRRFVASVFATKTGEFKSRAIAEAKESDLKARSKSVGPKVVGADLQVQLKGGGTVYSNQPAVFTATVTNNGNARAEEILVNIRWPQEADLRSIGKPELVAQSQQQSQPSEQQPAQQTPEEKAADDARKTADSGDAADSTVAANKEKEAAPNKKMNSEQFVVAALDAGQSAQFQFVVTSGGLEKIPVEVEALYVCAVEQAEDTEQAQVRKAAQAMATAQVIRLPALQIYAIDGTDPVQTGQEVVYQIRVRNEGDAPDQQVQVTATLPDELKFTSAEGPTEHKQEAQKIVFEPIEELAAGDEVEFTLVATPQGEGDVALKVELDSEAISTVVRSDEPTTLIKAQE